MIEAVEVKMPICKRGSDGQNREKMGQEDLLARSKMLDLVTGQEEPMMSVAVSNLLILSRASIILWRRG